MAQFVVRNSGTTPQIQVQTPPLSLNGAAFPTDIESYRDDVRKVRAKGSADQGPSIVPEDRSEIQFRGEESVGRVRELLLRLDRIKDGVQRWNENADTGIGMFVPRAMRNYLSQPMQGELDNFSTKLRSAAQGAEFSLLSSRPEDAALLDKVVFERTGKTIAAWERETDRYRTISKEEDLRSLSNTLGVVSIVPVAGLPFGFGKMVVDRLRGEDLNALELAMNLAAVVPAVGMVAKFGKVAAAEQGVARAVSVGTRPLPAGTINPDGPLSAAEEATLRTGLGRALSGRMIFQNAAHWVADRAEDAWALTGKNTTGSLLLRDASDSARRWFRSVPDDFAQTLYTHGGSAQKAIATRIGELELQFTNILGHAPSTMVPSKLQPVLAATGKDPRQYNKLLYELRYLRTFSEELGALKPPAGGLPFGK